MQVTSVSVRGILTRSSGFLRTVCSHSLQPYRGCSYGRALCGVGCYAQHNRWLARGEAWGSFLEARVNAAESYLAELIRVVPHWPRGRFLELAPKYWASTRARLDPAQLAAEIGPLDVPPAATEQELSAP